MGPGRAQAAGYSARLRPYLPRLAVDWFRDSPETRHRFVDGSLLFVDISGFTRLSERLAKRGRIGAEQLTDSLSAVFAQLLEPAYADGASLLKFGGDALLLLFTGPAHEVHAARAVNGMRAELRRCGTVATDGKPVKLRMSAGMHAGRFAFFLVGSTHREFLLTGGDVTTTVRMEAAANAGQVAVSDEMAARLPLGAVRRAGDINLLRETTIGRDLLRARETTEPGRRNVDLSACIPAGIREHLAGGGDAAEHRTATVAFVHYDGTDAMLASDGIDAVANALDALVSSAQTACDEYEVTFLASDLDADGGKVILLSGAPRATDNDEERMLLALRRIVETPLPLPVRAGVNRGHVFVGDVGPEYRRTYTVMGDTVNVAARLMAAARGGQILSTAPVLDRSDVRFGTTALAPLALKGKQQRVAAFAVHDMIGRRGTSSNELPFVGRTDELDTLDAVVHAAQRGTGGAIEISGEPGIGKSRLARELERRTPGFTTVTVRCEPYASSVPYSVVRTLLRHLLDLDAVHDADETTLCERIARLAPELLPQLPLLGTALDIDVSETPETAALEPRFRRERVVEAAVDTVERALPAGPAVITIEDVHYIDDASRTVVQRLAAHGRARGWIVCVTRRGDESSAVFGDEPDGVSDSTALAPVQLALRPLRNDAATALIHAATEQHPLLPNTTKNLVERSGGNPLFLEELARAVVAGIEDAPDSIAAVTTALLDRLPPAERRLVRAASVLGLRFDAAVLEAVLDTSLPGPRSSMWSDLRDYLSWDGGELQFRQTLVRDAAYQRLAYRERRALHGRAADALVATAADDTPPAVLSLHLFEAHRFADASRTALAAARRAADAYANTEAAELYERALASARHVDDVSDASLADTWSALGDVRDRAGDFAGATFAYREARRRSRSEPVACADLFLKEAFMAERRSLLRDALRWTARGLTCLEGVPDDGAVAGRARLLVYRAAIEQMKGRSAEAIAVAQQGVDLAQACGEQQALAQGYLVLDWAYGDRAIYAQQALRIYEELGDLPRQALALNNLGIAAYYEGRWDDAVELYERGREGRLRTGDDVEAARGTVNVAEILGDQGRLTECEAMLLDARRVWNAAGYRGGQIVTLLLGRTAARAGRFADAHRWLDEARADLAAIGADADVLLADAYTAECLVFEGRPVDALHTIADVVARADRQDLHMLDPLLRRLEGFAAVLLGDLEGARRALDASAIVATSLGYDHELAFTLDAFVRLFDDPKARVRRDELFEQLGIRTAPPAPLAP